MKKRLNIALFVAMLENEFSYAVCEGALTGAKEIDANLIVLPAGIVDAKYDDYDANFFRYQYNTLYSCVDPKSFDAVILEYGTLTSFLSDEKKEEFLKSFGDIPVMLLAGQHDGFSSVCIDNSAGLREELLYLIDTKGLKKIGFVSGPVETNSDARERLNVYYSTMKERNLEVSEDMVAYGNFSPFSEDVVYKLLDKHPDLEAVVCANDQMAIGVYNVLKKRGLSVGKDVLVTGFDDSPTSKLLEPKLASVKADIRELAYISVLECANMFTGKTINRYVRSRFIPRESVSFRNEEKEKLTLTLDQIYDDDYIKDLSDRIFTKYYNDYFENDNTRNMRQLLFEYCRYFLRLVDRNGKLILNHDVFLKQNEMLAKTYYDGYIDINSLLTVMFMLYEPVNSLLKNEDDKLLLLKAVSEYTKGLMVEIAKLGIETKDKLRQFEIVITNITRDMMKYFANDVKKYRAVLETFEVMNIPSAYMLTYDPVISHRNKDDWKRPETYSLTAYYDGKERNVSPVDRAIKLPSDSIFRSDIFPDRRCDLLVLPIFSGELQFGLMVIEAGLDFFFLTCQVVCQVGISMEIIDILQTQNSIKKKLENNLAKMEADNRTLDELSHTDQLTGVANRRGFMEKVRHAVTSDLNAGKRAFVLFADMDCLKIVNDEFGHDDGDFALKLIARCLSESFRQTDVVARMGGDEFAAFAIIDHDTTAEAIRDRIVTTLKKLNENDRPYYVDMSIGIHEFPIEKNVDIDEMLTLADEVLYNEKKNKLKVVYK
ncbi:MAG: GGDEF domain-containing protein [Lachnospiraceae bacterium]|nr:GGDEF domain-containing protein [Lachnospiraceae bacterium]